MDRKAVESLLEQHDKEIKQEIAKIEHSEQRIEDEEEQILTSQRKIVQKLQKRPFSSFFIQPGTTAKELGFFRSIFLRSFSRKRRLVYALIVTFAVVLIWRGMWDVVDNIPILSLGLVSLVVGIILIWILQKYTDLH